jgi:Family of unknown function (DUF5677)
MDDSAKTGDLTDRELLLQAHEICCATLLTFCEHFNQRLPLADLPGARLSILVATAVKAINTSQAIRMLCVDGKPFYEEMNVLVRSLIESIINGAFVQFATEDEVTAFMHFDSISLAKALRIAQGVSPEAANILSEKLRDEFRAHADSIKSLIGKDEQDFNWTRLDVVSRGDRIDKALGRPAFSPISKVLFPSLHAFVHGSYRSLEAYMPTEGGRVLQQNLDFQADGALHTMDVALLALCITMNHLAGDRLDPRLSAIQSLLVVYAERIKVSAPKTAAAEGF